jgi:Protein of unknown function (DUF3180)
MAPGLLTGAVVVGLILGWLFHPISERLRGSAPTVSPLQGLMLFFVAAILGATAWATRRAIRARGERPEPHRMVNRLVLARACALVGALCAGGYVGYAVSWLGDRADLAGERIAWSLVAACGGLTVMITALLLERACRVRSDDDAA